MEPFCAADILYVNGSSEVYTYHSISSNKLSLKLKPGISELALPLSSNGGLSRALVSSGMFA